MLAGNKEIKEGYKESNDIAKDNDAAEKDKAAEDENQAHNANAVDDLDYTNEDIIAEDKNLEYRSMRWNLW